MVQTNVALMQRLEHVRRAKDGLHKKVMLHSQGSAVPPTSMALVGRYLVFFGGFPFEETPLLVGGRDLQSEVRINAGHSK